MISLFEYASKHNVSIEIIPDRELKNTYRIRMKRFVRFKGRIDCYQENQFVCLDTLKVKQAEALIKSVLDKMVTLLDNELKETHD